jgi:hypothetical protein
MLMNSEHLANNYRHVTADTLINALAFPIENVKGGFIIARSFRAIARPVAGWLLDIIFDQGEKLHRRLRGDRDDDQLQPASSTEDNGLIRHRPPRRRKAARCPAPRRTPIIDSPPRNRSPDRRSHVRGIKHGGTHIRRADACPFAHAGYGPVSRLRRCQMPSDLGGKP